MTPAEAIEAFAIFMIGFGFGWAATFTYNAFHWARFDAAWEAYRIELDRRTKR